MSTSRVLAQCSRLSRGTRAFSISPRAFTKKPEEVANYYGQKPFAADSSQGLEGQHHRGEQRNVQYEKGERGEQEMQGSNAGAGLHGQGTVSGPESSAVGGGAADQKGGLGSPMGQGANTKTTDPKTKY